MLIISIIPIGSELYRFKMEQLKVIDHAKSINLKRNFGSEIKKSIKKFRI